MAPESKKKGEGRAAPASRKTGGVGAGEPEYERSRVSTKGEEAAHGWKRWCAAEVLLILGNEGYVSIVFFFE